MTCSKPAKLDENHLEQQPIMELGNKSALMNLQQEIFSVEYGSVVDDNKPQASCCSSKPKHFITGMEFTKEELELILQKAKGIKKNPEQYFQALAHKSLVMIFEKPSFRTRLSFAMAIQSMGGMVIECVSTTRKQEMPKDMMRVLNGYADFVMVRTHDERVLEEMALYATIPVINGLSAAHHPCQILADLLTIQEQFGCLEGLTLAYIGDSNNILNSLMLLAPQLGLKIHYCCPESKQPDVSNLEKTRQGMVLGFSKPEEAVKGAHVVYTDVWTSMGFEHDDNHEAFKGFQVNETLMSFAHPEAVFMHCMPMERGKEVSTTLPDSAASIIFRQSENRMHLQKALILYLNG